MLDALSSLVEKSLLRQREQEDGEPRFSMLEFVREYAVEQLEASGEAGAARLEFARYFKRLAEEAEPGIRSADQFAWVRRLSREHDNVKAAMALLLAAEPREGAAFVASVRVFWITQTYSFSEQHAWYAKALEADALLAGAAEARCEASGDPLEEWEQALRDRYVAKLRSTLDPATLEREWARGRALTLQEAAAAALAE